MSACTYHDSSPLIFGQGVTVGISVGPSTTNNAVPEIVVGVKQADIAVVPTVVPKDVPLPDQAHATRNIRGHSPANEAAEDALSTFGSFSNNTSVNNVNLGIFFATGIAAQNLSQGFLCAVAGIAPADCHPATKPSGTSDAAASSPKK